MNPFTVARLHSGLSQNDLSNITGLSQQLIQRAEDGLNNSPPSTLTKYFTKHWINGPQRFGEPPAMSAIQYWIDFTQQVQQRFPNKEWAEHERRYLLDPPGAENPNFRLPSFEAIYTWYVAYQRWCLPDLKPILNDWDDYVAVNGAAPGSALIGDIIDTLVTMGLVVGREADASSNEWLIAKLLHIQLTTVQQFAKKSRATTVPPVIRNIINTTGRKRDEVF